MSDQSLTGRCLCGGVTYEITGTVHRFVHCHCSRCRKATGTGHATNILLKPSSAVWLSGENLLKWYRVPEAERFATNFCSECGSLMPRVAPDMSVAVVPAGTLDSDPGILPEARIFFASKADWSCGEDELPQHPEYPPPR
jgi:hypothetical protein